MSTTRTLAGQTAVVTGASSGIGRAIAEELGAAGASVFLAGQDESDLHSVRAHIEASGGRAFVRSVDVRDTDSVARLMSDAITTTARLDVLVNSAGVMYPSSIMTGTPAEWRDMFETNVIALVTCCQLAVRVMRQRSTTGQIVNISSTASQRQDSGVYGATKHAVNCISSTLRRELRHESIRIINVQPGVTATNLFRHFDAEQLTQIFADAGLNITIPVGGRLAAERINALLPALRGFVAEPNDIADAVLYALQQPWNVNVSDIVVRPRASALAEFRISD